MAFAAPASRDGFSFSGDSFSVVASGHVHRRYALPELKAHFKTLGSAKAHPAHWYEAQLLHYGLPPSKVKGTAKMRLMEAVNAGKMTVPVPLTALERELKKTWTAANKKASAVPKKAPKLEKTAAGKRKAEGLELVANVNTGGSSIGVSVTINQEPQSKPSKRAKPTTKPQPRATPATKSTRNTALAGSSTSVAAPPRGKQTARRGRLATLPTRDAMPSPPSASPPPPRKQTARRGNFIIGRGAKHEPVPKMEDSHDGPYNYPVADTIATPQRRHGQQSSPRSSFTFRSDTDLPPPLGFINGRYEVLDTHFPAGGVTLLDDPRWLVCTIAGDQLWVSFHFGFVHGVMRTPSRPRRSSSEPLLFNWCGEDDDYYARRYDEHHQCRMAFVGDGWIEGDFDWGGRQVSFQARRLEGQPTRSEIPAQAMWEEWDQFCEG
ncbi:hypothetical protein CT0861_05030 [Colletotrichum tofieldiae]|uniref:Uncharacterized protein n=1 Tax=Colletotrichum tofieldiae TaxID=708197 RepID=A0A166NCA9_9PEZI|nr:hypothetical protein CT0861_05030 [Colletotrichum tofieldiae]